jgi:hypothetical protein
MASTVWFHIGMPKTGTSYLQSILWANKLRLREQGLLLPLGGQNHHYWAFQSLRGRFSGAEPRIRRSAWDRLIRAVDAWKEEAFITHELFSQCEEGESGAALSALTQVSGAVHLVLTVRNLADVLPSAWQQRVKQGESASFDDFMKHLDDDAPRHRFSQYQDLRRVLTRWQHGLPDNRIHLVTNPSSDGPNHLLLHRLAEALTLSMDGFELGSARHNRSLGRAETELLRRCNATLPRGELEPAIQGMLKSVGERVLGNEGSERLTLRPEHQAWAYVRSREVDAFVRQRGYTVHGDLDDLLVPESNPNDQGPPYFGDPVEDSVLLDIAAHAMERIAIAGYELGRSQAR